MEHIHHLIGGEQTPSSSGRTGPVFNPATGLQTAQVDLASIEEVDAAVASAAAAFPGWRATSVAGRVKLMFKFRELVERNADELARTISAEHGKTEADAGGEVARGLENIEYACGIAETLAGRFTEQASTGIDVYDIRQPLGVCAGITPFNFPAMVPLWMLPNAVAAGNTFILKPSEKDPSASQMIVELFHEAGFPPGVLNLVHGDKVAVDRLLTHPDIKAVSFVGSTPVARHVHETANANGKRVQALAGAKNHMVVLPDADVNLAADAAVSAAFGSAGERCMAISVVAAVGDIADPLVDAIRARTEALKIGPGNDPTSEMGPLITREHRDRVAGYVGAGESEGAEIVVDGRRNEFEGDGFFLGATVLDRVTPSMSVYRDEIFGPVLVIVRVDSYRQAVDLIADNKWGNGAAIFTRDGGAARQFQFDVDAGMVGINVPIPVPVANFSFGGWGDSLFGDTHMYGPDGLRFFTKGKVVTSRWPDPATSTVDLGFPTN
ncbi:MAG: CoA-acylating methylmalonate-semialdehyde dehydrogenase [Acidimicrobiia bacterium]|nr:CoA-acylating methylmalonate-semialdehyde dehydrogenase [Acidimicrobiia bacterium]